jgi:hypothetical protein
VSYRKTGTLEGDRGPGYLYVQTSLYTQPPSTGRRRNMVRLSRICQKLELLPGKAAARGCCRTPNHCAETFWSAKAIAFAFLLGNLKLSRFGFCDTLLWTAGSEQIRNGPGS